MREYYVVYKAQHFVAIGVTPYSYTNVLSQLKRMVGHGQQPKNK